MATGRLRLGGAACLVLRVPSRWRRLWSPQDPHLYGLRFRLLTRSGQVLDEVLSYVGLRTVTCKGDQILLNGEPIYLRMVLDQGYYPDGLWTAPTIQALRRDIQLAQRLGFNGARLHQKVFEPWYFHYADRCGFLVMAEYPDWPGNKTRRWKLPPGYRRLVLREWQQAVEGLHNHPSIIAWTALNEIGPAGGFKHNRGPGGGFGRYRDAAARALLMKEHRHFVKALVARVRRSDKQGRPVHDASGFVHVPAARPDIWSFHDYSQDPKAFRRVLQAPPPKHVEGRQGQPLFVAEYGGVGMEAGGPYGPNPKRFLAGYGGGFRASEGRVALAKVRALTEELYAAPSVAGFCYTQLYDVEYEKNGLLRYDRAFKPGLTLPALREVFGGACQACVAVQRLRRP